MEFKNEFNTEQLACRACLSTENKLFSIHNTNLLDIYKNLSGIDTTPFDLLPPYLCNYCSLLLLKFWRFRDSCHRAKNYLDYARTNNQEITTKYLEKFPKNKYTIKQTLLINVNSTLFKHAKLKKSIDANKKIKKPVIKSDESDDSCHDNSDINHDNDFSSEDEKNLKIFAQEIKLEINSETQDDIKKSETSKTQEKSKRTRQCSEFTENTKKVRKIKNVKPKTKSKYFENNQNMKEFEKLYNVQIIILSREEQIREMMERKMGQNYLHSPYRCELCYKGYMDTDTLNRHALMQHDTSKGDSVCDICKYRYKNSRELTQHVRNTHRLKFACRQCNNVTKFVFKAKEHYKKMHGGERYQCQHCGKTYQKLSSHLSHLRIHHPSKFLWCELCGEAFLGEKGLNTHNHKSHRHLSLPYKCSCRKSFASPEALSQHISYNNCEDKCCVHCGQGFSAVLELRDHLLLKHKDHKLYHCQKCDKTFNSEVTYSGHYRRFHVESRVLARPRVPWVCELCGKELASVQGFTVHMRIHNRERPYKCSVCPKTFTQRALLKIHTRTHTGERPYECTLCPKTFNNKPALNRHNRVHTGIKPYTCTQCGKSFSQSNSMKLHVYTVHLKMPAPYKSKARRGREKKDGKDEDSIPAPSAMHEGQLEDLSELQPDDMYDRKYKKKKICART